MMHKLELSARIKIANSNLNGGKSLKKSMEISWMQLTSDFKISNLRFYKL